MTVQSPVRYLTFLPDPGQRIEAVLFDMDGVLVDSIPLHVKAWNAALEQSHLPGLDRSGYMTALGRTNIEMIAIFLGNHGIQLPLEARKELVVRKETIFRSLLRQDTRILPGVLDWLDFLRAHQVRCAVASSGEMANVVAVLDALSLSDYFVSILSGARLPASKPDPTLFRLAAGSMGVAAERCLVIEDAPAGIQAAKAAGMLCLAVATTCIPADLRQADMVFQSLAEAAPSSLFAADPT